jgi:hypothetical protein
MLGARAGRSPNLRDVGLEFVKSQDQGDILARALLATAPPLLQSH